MTKSLFLYDGDCKFCSSCARFIERHIPTSAQVLPWQFVDIAELRLTQEECDEAVQWIGADGSRAAGPKAIAFLLVDARSYWKPLGWLLRIPPFSWLAEPIYRLIARNRHRLPGGTAACVLPQAARDSLRQK